MKTSCLLLGALLSLSDNLPAASIDVDGVMRVASRKLAAFDASQEQKSAYPGDAKGAKWNLTPPSDWVSGFYPGSLWYLYEYARAEKWPDAEKWRARAEVWTAGLESQQFNNNHHDVGFVVFDSFGNGYRLTGNPAYLPIINRTAQSLASRYRAETGMIRSWGKREDMAKFMVIIDNMMNLELLVWASRHGGTLPDGTSDDLYKIATSHADRTLELFFRPDASTYHVVELDPSNGAVQRKRTAQGKADESTWSRGQTWAIYGFAYMYEATGERRYLDASLKAADRYLAQLPADFVPPSDFSSGLSGLEYKDSSAAAIAASAFLRLHQLVDTPELKKKYLDAATSTLSALTNAPYFSPGDDKASLLVYAARSYHSDPDHALTNTSLIWGDYYLLEALLRYKALAASAQQPATSARFVPERKDDFAWENDLVAFRVYGPAILKDKGAEGSGIDCWLKCVKYPVIDKWYAGDQKGVSYHKDHGEGYDPYQTGGSRGCGGVAIWKNGKMVTAGPYKTWKIIASEPQKSVFELTYDYDVGGTKIKEVKRITIELGKRLFFAESTFTQEGKPAALEIAVGITTHDGKAKAVLNPQQRWMACWEMIDGAGVGTGVVMAPPAGIKMHELVDPKPNASHALLVTKTDVAGKVAYYAGYGWEKAGEISTPEKWENYLSAFAASLNIK